MENLIKELQKMKAECEIKHCKDCSYVKFCLEEIEDKDNPDLYYFNYCVMRTILYNHPLLKNKGS